MPTFWRAKGAKEVLGEHPDASVPGLEHARALATRGGIYDADVVLIPLEDGDRCEALVAMGKKVIAIDLNPLSRTARKATVSIVDNILRAVPNMAAQVRRLSKLPRVPIWRRWCRSTTKKRFCARLCRRYKITWKGSFERIQTDLSWPLIDSCMLWFGFSDQLLQGLDKIVEISGRSRSHHP